MNGIRLSSTALASPASGQDLPHHHTGLVEFVFPQGRREWHVTAAFGTWGNEQILELPLSPECGPRGAGQSGWTTQPLQPEVAYALEVESPYNWLDIAVSGLPTGPAFQAIEADWSHPGEIPRFDGTTGTGLDVAYEIEPADDD